MKKFLILFLTITMLSSNSMVFAENEEEAGLLDSEAVENELVDEFQNGYIDLDPVEDEEKQEIVIEKKSYIQEEKQDTSYMEVLLGLGLINPETDGKRVVNRAEFAHYLCFLAGYHEDGIYGTDMEFSDTQDSQYSKEINCVSSSKFMNGYGDGTFAPEKGISTVEAATAILRMAGYHELAEINGGYPKGYINFASSTGLFDDVVSEDALTYENLVNLLYNALFVPVMKVENGSYRSDPDEVVLIKRVDAECLKGKITATAFTSLYEKETVAEGNVLVTAGGVDYVLTTKNIDTEQLLGLEGYFYIRDEEELIAVEPLKNRYSAITISSSGIVDVNDTLTELEAIKSEGSNVKKYKIDIDAQFIYNGKNCFKVKKADIENVNGNIRLIDTDNNNEYDIVYIWNYTTYFVDSIIVSEKIVNDKTPGVFFKIDDANDVVKIKRQGKKATFSTIVKNDVLSVAESRSGEGKKLVSIVISSLSTEGEITYIGEDKIGIDGTIYEVSRDLDMSALNAGTKAVFGLNFMDQICCYKKIYTQETEYAYISDITITEGDYGDVCLLKFFSEDGMTERAVMAEKFMLNNEKCDNAGLMSALMADGVTKKQMIKLKRNKDGEIVNIYTSGEETIYGQNTSYEKLTFNKKYTGVRIRKANIQGDYIATNDTKVFVIVLDKNSEIMDDASGVYTISTSPVADGYRVTTYVYDAGEELVPGVVLFEIPESSYSSMLGNLSTHSMLINNISKAVGESNEVVTKVDGFLQGSKVSYIINDSLDVSDWKKGDIRMLTAIKQTKEIIRGRQFFGLKNETGSAPTSVLYRDTDYTKYPAKYNITETNDNTSQESPVYGTIKYVSYDGNYVVVELADESGFRIGKIASYSYFYTYNDRAGFAAVTKENITPGAKVYMMCRYANILELVMFED